MDRLSGPAWLLRSRQPERSRTRTSIFRFFGPVAAGLDAALLPPASSRAAVGGRTFQIVPPGRTRTYDPAVNS
jgi:hypothetical protein